MHAVVARSAFPGQDIKKHARTTFWRFRCGFAWQAHGILHLAKGGAKRKGFVASPKTVAGVGHLQRMCKDAFRVAGAVQETCSSEMLGGQGGDFLRGVAFWSIRRFDEMTLRDRCRTSYDLASIFQWQAQYFRQVEWKKRKTLWKSRRIASFSNVPIDR